ncbi:MAG: hypothetical protein OXH75_08235 [Acidobacteria bacterium]|nr:hypothetical protein [Acidobacteriota bacterium]
MTNAQPAESTDLNQESFTATIDPAKVDPENLGTLGRFLDDEALEKLAGGESYTVTIHRTSQSDQEWENWKNAVLAAAFSGG